MNDTDSALLDIVITEALAGGSLQLTWSPIREKAEAQGLADEVIEEARDALQQEGCLRIGAVAAGQPGTVELTSTGYWQRINAVVPDAGAARKRIITILVNDPPNGNRQVDDLAAATGRQQLFVQQLLLQLEADGYLKVSNGLGHVSRITGISRTLRRLLELPDEEDPEASQGPPDRA